MALFIVLLLWTLISLKELFKDAERNKMFAKTEKTGLRTAGGGRLKTPKNQTPERNLRIPEDQKSNPRNSPSGSPKTKTAGPGKTGS
jgi:hypothetical protein